MVLRAILNIDTLPERILLMSSILTLLATIRLLSSSSQLGLSTLSF